MLNDELSPFDSLIKPTVVLFDDLDFQLDLIFSVLLWKLKQVQHVLSVVVVLDDLELLAFRVVGVYVMAGE